MSRPARARVEDWQVEEEGRVPGMTIPGEALPDGPDTDIEGDEPAEGEEREGREAPAGSPPGERPER